MSELLAFVILTLGLLGLLAWMVYLAERNNWLPNDDD